MSSIPVLVTICATVLVNLVSATGVNIIDHDPNQPIEVIVRDICWSDNADKQISKVSTVTKVIDYLKSVPAEHEFASCARNNLPTLKHLKLVLSQGNEDPCSHTKLAFIEAFHRRSIDKKNAMLIRETPLIIRTFFLQYASMISEECAINGLKLLQSADDVVLDDNTNRMLDLYLKQFRKHIEISPTEYNRIFLVWGLVDQWPASVQGQLAKYLRYGQKRISIKVKNGQVFEKMQSVCLNRLKPVYQHSLLPSLRLINLGYYPSSPDLIQHLSAKPSARRLYDLVQLCEAIIPIKVVSDASIGDNQIIFLTAEEVRGLEYPTRQTDLPEEHLAAADLVSLIGLDQLVLVTENKATEIAERVEQDLYERDSSLSRMMQVIGQGVSKSLLKNFFMSSGDGSVKDFESTLGSVKQAIKEQKQQQLQMSLDNNQTNRPKRFLGFFRPRRNRWWRRNGCRGVCICFPILTVIRNVFYFFVLILMLIAYFVISIGF